MLNFITRFFQINPTAQTVRAQFKNYFFSMPEHQWFDETVKHHFEKLMTHLPVGVLTHLMTKEPLHFVPSREFSPENDRRSCVVIFPEFEKLLRSDAPAAVAFIAQEVALLLLEAEEPEMDELTRELEADKFVADLGLTFELEELLFMLDESVEKRLRLSYLTCHHFSN